jgi:hypothetical protein
MNKMIKNTFQRSTTPHSTLYSPSPSPKRYPSPARASIKTPTQGSGRSSAVTPTLSNRQVHDFRTPQRKDDSQNDSGLDSLGKLSNEFFFSKMENVKNYECIFR